MMPVRASLPGSRPGWTGERYQLSAMNDRRLHKVGSIGMRMPSGAPLPTASGYPASLANNAGSWIRGEHALQPAGAGFGAIDHHHHAGVLGVADAYSPAL